MKTVKIILKFKFLTLFSDKIIQCYTESTVYTIITLFLYGIGAISNPFHQWLIYNYYIIPIWNWSNSINNYPTTDKGLLHYSYMELERHTSPSKSI